MTNQLQGEILFKGWAGGELAKNWVYTPWMPVRGDIGTFGVEVTYYDGGTSLTWNVETRTLEDPGTSDLLADQVTAFGPASITATTLALELVRYKFSTGSGASATDFVIFRALQPSWQQDR